MLAIGSPLFKQQQWQQEINAEQTESLKQNFIRLSSGCVWLKENMKEQQAKLILAEEYLQTHAPFLPMFEQSQSIVTDLNAVLLLTFPHLHLRKADSGIGTAATCPRARTHK